MIYLKNGDEVVLRSGDFGFVRGNLIECQSLTLCIQEYNENFQHLNNKDWDIVEVWQGGNLIFGEGLNVAT